MLFIDRLNPLDIIFNHFRTFRDDAKDQPCYLEMIIHVLGPILAAYLIVFSYNITVTKEIAASMLNGFAILGGFLINSAFVITEKKNKSLMETPNKRHDTLIKETFSNVLFEILVCFVAVIVCAVYPFAFEPVAAVSKKAASLPPTFIQSLLSSVILTLAILFTLTLLMVLKRLNKIFH